MEDSNDIKKEQINAWDFPDLGVFQFPEENFITTDNLAATLANKEKELIENKNKLDEEIKKQAILQAELKKLKEEYTHKLKTVNHLLDKLQDPITMIDGEIFLLIQDMLKKSIKRIIQKEINDDNGLIDKMIAELKAIIPMQDGMITVYVSQTDYDRLQDDTSHSSTVVKTNEELQPGDIIIKTHFTEIRALLNERIDQLVGDAHD